MKQSKEAPWDERGERDKDKKESRGIREREKVSDKGRKEAESESGNKLRESESEKEKESESGKERVKVIEGVIFIPFTLDSKLREEIQRVEETLTAEMRTPSIRFLREEESP